MCPSGHRVLAENNSSITQLPDDSMAQFFNQHLRLLQVFGIKPFGEPVIHIRQQLVSLNFGEGIRGPQL